MHFTVCTKNIVDEVKDEISGEVFSIDIFMLPPWRKLE